MNIMYLITKINGSTSQQQWNINGGVYVLLKKLKSTPSTLHNGYLNSPQKSMATASGSGSGKSHSKVLHIVHFSRIV